ncbi:BCCT family transporter [Francisella persica]
MSIFVYLCLVLMFSCFGDINLGQDHELPEYINIHSLRCYFCRYEN